MCGRRLVVFFVLFLILSSMMFFNNSMVDASYVFGNTGTTASTMSMDNNYKGINATPTSGNGKLKSMKANLLYTSAGGPWVYQCALYDASWNLVATSESKSIALTAVATWYEFNFSSHPSLVNNTVYRIFVKSSNPAGVGVITYTVAGYHMNLAGGAGAFPAVMAGFTYVTKQPSLYAIYNVTPTMSLVSPTNGSADVVLQPKCSVTVYDRDGDPLTVTWQSNATGSWVTKQVNLTVTANTTTRWIDTDATTENQWYWYRVWVNDGFSNVSSIYKFRTRSLPEVSGESPADGEIDVSFPASTCVNISYEFGESEEERYEWYNPGPMSYGFIGKNFWSAQNFTVGAVGTNEDFCVTNITLELVRITGKTVGDVTVSIRSNISGPDLCNGTIDGDLLIDDSTPPMLERINITMSPSVVLSASANYFIVTRAVDAEDTSSLGWYYLFAVGAYPGGWFFNSNDYGVTWTGDTYNTSDHWFNVWGITGTDCIHYEFWTNESGAWVEYENGSACGNGTYCAINNFALEDTKYWWSINISYPTGWLNTTFNFTTMFIQPLINLSGETPANGSTIVYTFPWYLGITHFNMSIQRNDSKGYDMNTTVWFDGVLLFSNLTWGNGTILFDLFDYWTGTLYNNTFNWTVNASDGLVWTNQTFNFTFQMNVTGGALFYISDEPELSYLLIIGLLGSLLVILVVGRKKKQ